MRPRTRPWRPWKGPRCPRPVVHLKQFRWVRCGLPSCPYCFHEWADRKIAWLSQVYPAYWVIEGPVEVWWQSLRRSFNRKGIPFLAIQFPDLVVVLTPCSHLRAIGSLVSSSFRFKSLIKGLLELQRKNAGPQARRLRPSRTFVGKMMPKVLNKRIDTIPEGAVYVGRPSKWGNPWSIGTDGTREEVITFYRNALPKMLTTCRDDGSLILDLNELRGKDLVCWCTPLPCHADVLLELANA